VYVADDHQCVTYAAAVLQAEVEGLEETLLHVVAGRVDLGQPVNLLARGVQDGLQGFLAVDLLQLPEVLEGNP